MKYEITRKDFDIAFSFALNYHLDPKKSQSSRTSGASRGLGGVLDSFILGKLVELGVARILESLNSQKSYELDFDIKQNNEVLKEPDIIGVIENNKKRNPRCFIEIKNISKDDRWIGLTLEQFETIKNESSTKKAFIVGAYIQNNNQGDTKNKDLLGIYLKEKFAEEIFKEFTDLENIEIVIDYTLSLSDLEECGHEFKKNSFMYETEIFQNAGKKTEKDILEGKIKKIGSFDDGILEKYTMNINFPPPRIFGEINFCGKIELYEKINPKSTKRFIRCLSDVIVTNKVLGEFFLKENNIYLFNICTVGRNPVLNRNNIWVAKRSIPFLQKKGTITSVEDNLNYIAKEI